MKALYLKIFNDIKDKIKSNKLKPGDAIPSEAELRKKYDCSRDTVRKATALLEQNNLIIKSRGKASIVAENRQYLFPTSSLESFKEVAEKNKLDAKTIFVSEKIIDRSELESESKLNCDKLLELKRIRQINGEKIVLDIDYFDPKYVSKITKEIADVSIYKYIENELQIQIDHAIKIVTIDSPTSEDKKLLDISPGDLLVKVSSDTFTKSGAVFQHSISKHRSDKFIFTSYALR